MFVRGQGNPGRMYAVQGQGCELRGVCGAAAKRHVDGTGPLARGRDSMRIPRIFIVGESEGAAISSVLGIVA
jgi:hypothetical protein